MINTLLGCCECTQCTCPHIKDKDCLRALALLSWLLLTRLSVFLNQGGLPYK